MLSEDEGNRGRVVLELAKPLCRLSVEEDDLHS